MNRRPRRASRGVTVLEILMAIFVMLIGLTGVIALFPIGVKLSQQGTDDVIGAMTAQGALAAVQLQIGLIGRVKGYAADSSVPLGDVLCWKATAPQESRGVENVTGTVANVGTGAVGDPLGLTKVQVTCSGVDSRTLDVKQTGSGLGTNPTHDNCALLLITSGTAMWKLYRLDNTSSFSTSQFGSASSVSPCTNFPADGVKTSDSFRLIGARDEKGVWATVPGFFYTNVNAVPQTSFVLGKGAAPGYGYLAIVTRVKGYTNMFRVDVLVYKGYDSTAPPEGNLPAVACYTTILSGNMLR